MKGKSTTVPRLLQHPRNKINSSLRASRNVRRESKGEMGILLTNGWFSTGAESTKCSWSNLVLLFQASALAGCRQQRKVSTLRGSSPIIAGSAVRQNCSCSDELYALKGPETGTKYNEGKLLMLISQAEMLKGTEGSNGRVWCQVREEGDLITKYCKYEMERSSKEEGSCWWQMC